MNMTATPNVARFNEGEFTPRAWHLVANNLAGSRQQAWHKYQNSHDREHAYLRDVPASVRTLPARTHAIAVICVIGLSIAAVLITSRVAEYVLANRTPIAGLASPNLNASRFMLNGLLVPALDSDAMPLRCRSAACVGVRTRQQRIREWPTAGLRRTCARETIHARMACERMSPFRCTRAAVRW